MKNVFKTTLPTLGLDAENEQAKELLTAAKKEMGMIPTMYGNMANFPDLLSTYRHGYAALRKNSTFTSAELEVVFLSISFVNQCEYCMAAHSFLADVSSKVPKDVTDALRAGFPIADKKLSALSDFTKTMVTKKGNPAPEDVEGFLAAGYNETQILEIILAISVKIISNYSNHIFHTVPDAAFQSRVWTAPEQTAQIS
ncbi:MAG: alkylhydroperoxidase [Flavobacteriales bacterium CG_4_9_14_3_um_filter_40_17]|nr:carboxymuconolactone decarboxylase family protein [Leptospira sp.]PJB11540.1 MAG: alkylhydroperoxidase [Flavobacteriales bacterium CG_4_9_14_3_um_filter_40_17]